MSSGPLRILLVGDYDDDPTLGSAKVAHKLREHFRALGHECDALFSGDIGATPKSRQVRQLVSPAMAYRAIDRALARKPYDVVDAAAAEGLWLSAVRRAGRHRRVASICRSNGLEQLNYARMLADASAGLTHKPWTRRVWYPVSRLSQVAAAARIADRLIVLNERDRQYAVDRGWKPSGQVDLIPHGASEAFARSEPDGSRGRGVLFCGTWDHVKGTRYISDAWRILVDAGRHVPLTILGPGRTAADVLADFDERSRPHVTVRDRAPEAEVATLYAQHDCLVFASTYEGFGLVVLEAMSQRLPVIATPVGCAATLVKDGETGLLVPPRDARAIAHAVIRMLDDAGERRRLAANGAAAVAQMSWSRTAARTLETYRAAMADLQ